MAVCVNTFSKMHHNLFFALQHSANAVPTGVFSIRVDVFTATSLQEVR